MQVELPLKVTPSQPQLGAMSSVQGRSEMMQVQVSPQAGPPTHSAPPVHGDAALQVLPTAPSPMALSGLASLRVASSVAESTVAESTVAESAAALSARLLSMALPSVEPLSVEPLSARVAESPPPSLPPPLLPLQPMIENTRAKPKLVCEAKRMKNLRRRA